MIDKSVVRRLAAQHKIRFVGGSIDGQEADLFRFAEALVCAAVTGTATKYCLWADGTYCAWDEREQMTHMSDDFTVVYVREWSDDGEPMFPGGLR